MTVLRGRLGDAVARLRAVRPRPPRPGVGRLRAALRRAAPVAGAVRSAGPAALVAVLALAAVWPALVAPGLFATRAGGDSPFLLQRVFEMAVALRGGHIPPRWMPDAAFGLGYPFWNYYAPLAYLAAGGVAVLGGGVIGAIKVTQAACFVAAALGAHRLARRSYGAAAAGVAAAAVYTFAPYHLLNVYVRGDALAELAAYAVAPWLLVAVDDVVTRASARATARLALLAAALPLAHNISALLFAPVAVAYSLWRLAQRRRLRAAAAAPRPAPDDRPSPRARPAAAVPPPPRAVAAPAAPLAPAAARADDWLAGVELRGWRLWRAVASPTGAVLGAAALGAGVAAWFWAPALLEQRAVQLAGNTTGYFSYRNHFLALVDLGRWLGPRGDGGGALDLIRGLVTGPAVLDPTPWVVYDTTAGVPATTGLVVLAAALAGAVAAWRTRARRGAVAFWGLIAVAATLLTTALSWPLWAAVRPLAWAQFPWRWLNVQALALALLAGGLGAWPWGGRRGRWAVVLGAAVALAGAGLARLPREVLSIDAPTADDLRAFELFSGNLGTTVRGEYVPWAVNPRPASSVHVVAGVRVGPRAVDGTAVDAALVREGVARQTWQVDVTGDAERTLAWPTWWFPGWMAVIDDGVPQPTAALDGSGWLTAAVPPGRHLVTLQLQRTTVRALAELASLAALAAVGLLWLCGAGRLRLGRRAAAAAIGVAAAVACARALPTGAASAVSTLDWARMPYPSGHPGGVRFGPNRLMAARFEGLDDPTVPVTAGGALSIALDWTAPVPGQIATLTLASPAAAPLGLDEDWSVAREPITTSVGATLPIPPEVPAGVWFVRLAVADAEGEGVPATNAAGHDVDAVYLGPVRIAAAARTASPPPTGPVIDAGEVALDEVRWAQTADRLTVRLTWRAKRLLTADLKTSVRLRRAGEPVAGADGVSPLQVDAVPGYGFNPPTAWPVGVPVEDRRWLRLPPGLAAGDDYALEVVIYDAWTSAEVGRGQVDGVVIAAVPR